MIISLLIDVSTHESQIIMFFSFVLIF